MRNTLLTLAGVLSMLACNNSKAPEKLLLTSSNWLLGHWQNNDGHGIYSENWSQVNDSVFTAESFYIMQKDTPSSERVRLEQHGNDLFYIPTVDRQNNNQPVSFKLTKATDNQLLFENPDHDFPKSIVYTLVNKDSMVAYISGPKEGKQDTLYFPMSRTN